VASRSPNKGELSNNLIKGNRIMWTERNPFLQGPFEPLRNEYLVSDLHVEGEIPRELDGVLYRTGTNQHFRPTDPDRFHWFDGDGMVHAFRLHDGKASYVNRLVETDGLKAERAAGQALYNGIFGRAGAPQRPLPDGAPAIKSVAGINVIRFADRVLTMHEIDSYYWELDPRTLETLGKYDFGGAFRSMITAHPHFDHHAGEMLFYALDNEASTVECFAAAPDGRILSRHTVELPFAPFVHDFIFTEHYYVFFFGPIRCRPYAPDRVPLGKSALSFDAETGGRALIVRRDNGHSRWFETDSFTVGHYLNAYEEGQQIIVDASVTRTVRSDGNFNVEDFFPFPLVDEPSPFAGPELRRMIIDLSNGVVTSDRIGDFNAEFVRPNETMMGRPLRYGYMAGTHAPRPETRGFNCIVKHDYVTGHSTFQHLNSAYDMTPGEPIFVPRNGATEEDDGWIMAVWWDPRRNASEMVILAAQDLDGEPVARICLDHHVPLGFHGNWIDGV
jgi:carotenoid cleavage dioxygenase